MKIKDGKAPEPKFDDHQAIVDGLFVGEEIPALLSRLERACLEGAALSVAAVLRDLAAQCPERAFDATSFLLKAVGVKDPKADSIRPLKQVGLDIIADDALYKEGILTPHDQNRFADLFFGISN